MKKTNLFTHFWYIVMSLVITVITAITFVPSEEFVPAVADNSNTPDVNEAIPAHWISKKPAINDINLIVFFILVSIFALVGIFVIIKRIIKNKQEFQASLKAKNSQEKLVAISAIISILTLFVFFISISIVPYITYNLREDLVLGTGETLNVIKNPDINNQIYFEMLVPVFVSILPLVYITFLAISFEIKKRKDEKHNVVSNKKLNANTKDEFIDSTNVKEEIAGDKYENIINL